MEGGWKEVEHIVYAAVGGALAMFGTLVGALPVLILRPSSRESLERLIDTGLGFSSGVMLVASFLSLLLPSIEGGGLFVSIGGLVAGALLVAAANQIIPHEHLVKGFEGPEEAKRKIKATWLVALAIIIHNLPEGFSIGAAMAYSIEEGMELAFAIAIQDLPEGLAVAIPMYAMTGSARSALLIAALTGSSELFAAVFTAAFLYGASGALFPALAFAAGAMIYVVSHEALPESHRSGREKEATVGFFLGFIAMLIIDHFL